MSESLHHEIILTCWQLDTHEEQRKLLENRLRSTTSDEDWGWKLDESEPLVLEIRHDLELALQREKAYTKELEVRMMDHPIWPWVQKHKGLNSKSVGRWLGSLPRPLHTHTPGQWFHYSGLHVWQGNGYKIKSESGQMDYNPKVKPRLHIMANNVIRNADPEYRAFYDEVKPGEGTLHNVDCSGQDKIVPNVGLRRIYCPPPKGVKRQPKRALAGEPMGDGHRHSQAIRRLMKQLIKDAYNEVK